jgi:hypothetical protein
MSLDISALSSALDIWELAGFTVAVAIAVGGAGALTHELLPSWLSSWGWWKEKGNKASALLLLALAAAQLVIQVKVSSVSGQIIGALSERTAILQTEAAAANERTAKIEEAAKWRDLTPAQKAHLRSALSARPDITVLVAYTSSVGEGLYFAVQIHNSMPFHLFQRWQYNSAIVFGVRIPDVKSTRDDVNFLRKVFLEAQILFTTDPVPSPEIKGGTFGRYNDGNELPIIVVGEKPIPILQ